jgi:uncharacterized protein
MGYIGRMTPHHSQIVAQLRTRFPQVQGIYAFGSRVQGGARPDSDLDLAVLLPGYAEPLALWDAAQVLSEALGMAVDLLDLRAASTVMQHQVLTQGERLWGQEPDAGLFECFAMTEKLRLDESRQALLADIVATGRIHGR